jgi:hypothetical protein
MFLLEYIKVKLRIRVKLFSLESVEEALHYNISFLLVLSFLLLSLFNCKLTLFYQLYSWSLPWSPLFYFSKSAFICFMILLSKLMDSNLQLLTLFSWLYQLILKIHKLKTLDFPLSFLLTLRLLNLYIERRLCLIY